MADSRFKKILKGYENREGSKRFWSYQISGSASHRKSSKIARNFGAFCKKLSETVCYTSTRGYGLFCLGFGLLTLLSHFVKDYFDVYSASPLLVLISGAAFAALGIPFLTVDKPLFPALQAFRPTDYILFEFFCMKRMQNVEEAKGIHPVIMLFAGLSLATLGAFIPLWIVVAAILVTVYLFFTFMSPEFSFLMMFLAMPFLSEVGVENVTYLSAFVCVTLISFVRKVTLGKRVCYVEQYDLLLFIFGLIILGAGYLFNDVAFLLEPLYMFILSFGYTLTSSFITNRRLADCVINAIVISSIPVSLLSVIDFVTVAFIKGLRGFGGVSNPFPTPSSLAAFLIVSIVFCFYFLLTTKSGASSAFYAFVLAFNLVAVCITLSISAVVALIIGAIAYPVTKIRRISGLILALLALVPYVFAIVPPLLQILASRIPFIPAEAVERLVYGWQRAYALLIFNPLAGTGPGDGSFIPQYASVGGVGENCSNFFLQLSCEAGIPALILLAVFFIVRLSHRDSYRKYLVDSQVEILSRLTTVCTVSLVAFGAFNYLWEDLTIYYLFWCVMAIGSATLRISRREFDDRVEYYSDGSSAHYSAVDVQLEG